MRRHRRRHTNATPRHDRHLHAVDESHDEDAADGFLTAVGDALADPQPLALLTLASTIVSTLDPRTPPGAQQGPDAAAMLESLIGHPTRETTALLVAFAALLPDNYLAQRARAEAGRRDHPLPDWLLALEDAQPGPAISSTDLLGDGENAIVSLTLPGGTPVTAVVYIDHNLGTVVKDAFVVPDDPHGFQAEFLAIADDPTAIEVSDLDPGEARARIVEGIEMGGVIAHRLDSDTWPACRPIVEWIVGRLPATGVGFQTPEWTERQRSTIVTEFLRSPEAADLTDPDDGRIALDLVRFTTDYSGGDPLRWSLVNVEILLADWFPRAIAADERYLLRMPTVLRALVRYAHRHKEIPPHLTEETLDAVDRWEPTYHEAIGHHTPYHHPFGYTGGLYGDELMGQWQVHARERAARAVGGDEALAALDAAPLPDEDFQWTGIPQDVRERVAEVLRLCDGCAEEMFDIEMRTAFRRVLARTASVNPGVFRRRSKDATAAAAIAWAVVSANNLLGSYTGGLTAKALLGHFGVTGSVSARANPFVASFGAEEWQYAGDLTFGTPQVLVASRRAELIRARDTDR